MQKAHAPLPIAGALSGDALLGLALRAASSTPRDKLAPVIPNRRGFLYCQITAMPANARRRSERYERNL
jgi:hypothetical protein